MGIYLWPCLIFFFFINNSIECADWDNFLSQEENQSFQKSKYKDLSEAEKLIVFMLGQESTESLTRCSKELMKLVQRNRLTGDDLLQIFQAVFLETESLPAKERTLYLLARQYSLNKIYFNTINVLATLTALFQNVEDDEKLTLSVRFRALESILEVLYSSNLKDKRKTLLQFVGALEGLDFELRTLWEAGMTLFSNRAQLLSLANEVEGQGKTGKAQETRIIGAIFLLARFEQALVTQGEAQFHHANGNELSKLVNGISFQRFRMVYLEMKKNLVELRQNYFLDAPRMRSVRERKSWEQKLVKGVPYSLTGLPVEFFKK